MYICRRKQLQTIWIQLKYSNINQKFDANEWTFVCGHSVPQQSGYPYFVIIKDGKAIHPKPYEYFEYIFTNSLTK